MTEKLNESRICAPCWPGQPGSHVAEPVLQRHAQRADGLAIHGAIPAWDCPPAPGGLLGLLPAAAIGWSASRPCRSRCRPTHRRFPAPATRQSPNCTRKGRTVTRSRNSAEPGFKQRKKVALQYIKADLQTSWTRKSPKITDEEVQAYYEDNKQEFRNVALPPGPTGATATEPPAWHRGFTRRLAESIRPCRWTAPARSWKKTPTTALVPEGALDAAPPGTDVPPAHRRRTANSRCATRLLDVPARSGRTGRR